MHKVLKPAMHVERPDGPDGKHFRRKKTIYIGAAVLISLERPNDSLESASRARWRVGLRRFCGPDARW